MKRTLKDYLTISSKGIAMGAADVIPGVSGGTIAFISGIYEELINSIKSINLNSLKSFKTGGIKGIWTSINGNFLFALLIGIGISIISLSKGILFLLANFPVILWSFFFGLILASAFLVAKSIRKWNIGVILGALAGMLIAYYVTVMSPTETPTDTWFIFLSGAIAICAMILPGISGSFILLLMGKYEYILGAVKDLKISIIFTFALGCGIGLVSFSHVLSWMFKKFHDLTIALLAGFMIGSLNKVWPWKEVVEKVVINGKEKILKEANLLPDIYASTTGNSSYLAFAILAAITGFAVIFILDKVAAKKSNAD